MALSVLALTACAPTIWTWNLQALNRAREATVELYVNGVGASGVWVRCASQPSVLVTPTHVARVLSSQFDAHASADIAVLPRADGPPGLDLAPDVPPVGTPLWIVHSPAGDRMVGVGAVSERVSDNAIRVYAQAFFGSSGGATVDEQGRLVGVLTGGFYVPPQVVPGYAEAVPVERVRELIDTVRPGCLSPPAKSFKEVSAP